MEYAIIPVLTLIYTLLGLGTVRYIAWYFAKTAWREQNELCYEGCSYKCTRKKPMKGWESPAHAFANLHPIDWFCAWAGGAFWPVVVPVYAAWKPVKWFLAHEPRDCKPKLTADERIALAHAELEAATEEMEKAQE